MDFSELDVDIEGSQDGFVSSKNRVDIVFVIDNSGSMSSVIEGVKKHIDTFVTSLETNANKQIDFRIGFVMHGNERILVKNFTDSVADFKQAMERTRQYETGWDEFGLPAIDIAADFPWEEKRHKFVIIFTDEDVNGGHLPDIQLEKFPELLSKLEALRIKIYYLGVDSTNYREFKKIPGTYYEPNDDFESVNFSRLLEKIGKSVSQASGVALQGGNKGFAKDLYNAKNYVKIESL